MQKHFTSDNTSGYTDRQLALANAIVGAAGLDPYEESDAYKAHCETVLEAVEGATDRLVNCVLTALVSLTA